MKTPTLASRPRTLSKSVFFLSMMGLLSVTPLSYAAESCKGLQQDACKSNNSCSWINSYTTKKGNTINAYCRNKPKSSSSNTAPGSNTSDQSDRQG
jgi:hypothetical protein